MFFLLKVVDCSMGICDTVEGWRVHVLCHFCNCMCAFLTDRFIHSGRMVGRRDSVVYVSPEVHTPF